MTTFCLVVGGGDVEQHGRGGIDARDRCKLFPQGLRDGAAEQAEPASLGDNTGRRPARRAALARDC